MPYRLHHARLDRAHCLVPGLFQSLGPRQRSKSLLEVRHATPSATLSFRGPELLGADDLRVLQVVVAAVGAEQILVDPTPSTRIGELIRQRLIARGDWETVPVLAADISPAQLAHELGYADSNGGAARKKIQSSVHRLSQVRIAEERPRIAQSQVISYAWDPEDARRLYIALNPRLSDVLDGNGVTMQFTRISLVETRTLRSSAGRILHNRLSAFIDPGKERDLRLETLIGYCYPVDTSKSTSAIKKRRKMVRDSLQELTEAGWQVSESGAGRANIKRPA